RCPRRFPQTLSRNRTSGRGEWFARSHPQSGPWRAGHGAHHPTVAEQGPRVVHHADTAGEPGGGEPHVTAFTERSGLDPDHGTEGPSPGDVPPRLGRGGCDSSRLQSGRLRAGACGGGRRDGRGAAFRRGRPGLGGGTEHGPEEPSRPAWDTTCPATAVAYGGPGPTRGRGTFPLCGRLSSAPERISVALHPGGTRTGSGGTHLHGGRR